MHHAVTINSIFVATSENVSSGVPSQAALYACRYSSGFRVSSYGSLGHMVRAAVRLCSDSVTHGYLYISTSVAHILLVTALIVTLFGAN